MNIVPRPDRPSQALTEFDLEAASSGHVIVPLDAPPLVKLARHLREAGFVAVAFPAYVLVLIGRQEACCGRFASVRIKTFSEALGILRSNRPPVVTSPAPSKISA
jgi:hypothetical protein